MDSKTVIRDLRHKFGMNGWYCLIYYGILNVSVLTVTVIDALIHWLQDMFFQDSLQPDFDQTFFDHAVENGWGYLLACIAGGLALLIWKKPDFYFHQIWSHEKSMSCKAFIIVFCVFISGQAIQLVQSPVLEWLLKRLGFSVASSVKSSSAGSNSISMFLYVAIFAPVFEEIFFRGLILRNLLPYGKKLSIVASSFLFGVLHGNIFQSPYAFLVGLVLGYVAVEYGLVWSIVLHMFNNLILGELPTQIAKLVPVIYIDLALYALIFACGIATLVLAAVKWRVIAAYLGCRKIHPWCLRSFFSAWGVIIFTAIMLLNMLPFLLP